MFRRIVGGTTSTFNTSVKRVDVALRARWPEVTIDVHMDRCGEAPAINELCEEIGTAYTIGLIANAPGEVIAATHLHGPSYRFRRLTR